MNWKWQWQPRYACHCWLVGAEATLMASQRHEEILDLCKKRKCAQLGVTKRLTWEESDPTIISGRRLPVDYLECKTSQRQRHIERPPNECFLPVSLMRAESWTNDQQQPGDPAGSEGRQTAREEPGEERRAGRWSGHSSVHLLGTTQPKNKHSLVLATQWQINGSF